MIAEQVALHPSFYVIDLSHFGSNAEQNRFATEFAEALYRIKAKNKSPLHLFLDEADSFAPQQPMPGEQRMLGAFQAIVRRGRIHGIGITLISQRAAVINKSVLTQTECLIVLQTTSPQDQKAIESWVKNNGSEDEKNNVLSSLASLPKGEAWIWSPSWLGTLKRIKIRDRLTYNSSATPKFEEGKRYVGPTLKPIDMEALSAQIKSTIQQAEENNPSILRARIKELEKELTTRNPSLPSVKMGEIEKLKDRILDLERELRAHSIRKGADSVKIGKAISILQNLHTINASEIVTHTIPENYSKGLEIEHRPPSSPTTINESEITLAKGERNLLAALVQWYPNGMTEGQMRTHAGLRKSGTFSTYKSTLRKKGLLEDKAGLLYATESALRFLGESIHSPKNTSEVLSIWMPKLSEGVRRMLQCLVDRRGESITDEELQTFAELKKSGTYSTYKAQLRTAQLITVIQGRVAANIETLLMERK
ncbi:ATP-binding protein [Leptospira ainazelensis]|uniref:ATP-binding protein n=1 Tax=Leptospira ainazelensis TaxID=2810034 RepID=UPI001E5B522C|nr:DUF853 family protein [Leptospira ainazelensis]